MRPVGFCYPEGQASDQAAPGSTEGGQFQPQATVLCNVDIGHWMATRRQSGMRGCSLLYKHPYLPPCNQEHKKQTHGHAYTNAGRQTGRDTDECEAIMLSQRRLKNSCSYKAACVKGEGHTHTHTHTHIHTHTQTQHRLPGASKDL